MTPPAWPNAASSLPRLHRPQATTARPRWRARAYRRQRARLRHRRAGPLLSRRPGLRSPSRGEDRRRAGPHLDPAIRATMQASRSPTCSTSRTAPSPSRRAAWAARFGGKETQAACSRPRSRPSARCDDRPALPRCRLDRDDDMNLTGKRHDFLARLWWLGVDSDGRIAGVWRSP